MASLSCLSIFEAGSFGSDSGTVVIPSADVPFPITAGAVWTSEGVATVAWLAETDSDGLFAAAGLATVSFGGAADAAGLFASAGVASAAFVGTSVGDPFFSSVVLLSGFEGSDASTTLDDESASNRAMTCVANAQIDTAQKKFGASSLLLDGTGDYVSMLDSTDFDFPGKFTMECHARINSLAGSYLLCKDTASGGFRSWAMGTNANGSIFFYLSTDGTALSTITSATLQVSADGSFHHIAVDRDASNVVRIYLDGVMKASNTFAGTTANTTAVPVIGAISNGTTSWWNGWVDEVRVTKGEARYASDGGFTPPVAAYLRV